MKNNVEQYDAGIAFAKGVREGQPEGKPNRKILSRDKMIELLGTNKLEPIPDQIRLAFVELDVYVRKQRGREYWSVWWDTKNTKTHGRGVKKNGTM